MALPSPSLLMALLCLTAAVEARSWFNSLDRPYIFDCPKGQALRSIHSIHYNGAEDRLWNYTCHSIPGIIDCRFTVPANNYDSLMNFQCPHNHVIGGMAGAHSNPHEDRIYFFSCCETNFTLTNCHWTPDLNNYDGPVFYSLHPQQVFQGFYSRHSNSPEDRIWRVHVCDVSQ